LKGSFATKVAKEHESFGAAEKSMSILRSQRGITRFAQEPFVFFRAFGCAELRFVAKKPYPAAG
jgi:hypothetical protein